jgi:hypothetical protein
LSHEGLLAVAFYVPARGESGAVWDDVGVLRLLAIPWPQVFETAWKALDIALIEPELRAELTARVFDDSELLDRLDIVASKSRSIAGNLPEALRIAARNDLRFGIAGEQLTGTHDLDWAELLRWKGVPPGDIAAQSAAQLAEQLSWLGMTSLAAVVRSLDSGAFELLVGYVAHQVRRFARLSQQKGELRYSLLDRWIFEIYDVGATVGRFRSGHVTRPPPAATSPSLPDWAEDPEMWEPSPPASSRDEELGVVFDLHRLSLPPAMAHAAENDRSSATFELTKGAEPARTERQEDFPETAGAREPERVLPAGPRPNVLAASAMVVALILAGVGVVKASRSAHATVDRTQLESASPEITDWCGEAVARAVRGHFSDIGSALAQCPSMQRAETRQTIANLARGAIMSAVAAEDCARARSIVDAVEKAGAPDDMLFVLLNVGCAEPAEQPAPDPSEPR